VYSFSLDYLFNRVYDVLLSIKYGFYFVLLGTDKAQYLADVKDYEYEGLRDRGWLDDVKVDADKQEGFFDKILSKLGFDTNKDTDGDGIPNTSDSYPNDPNNLSSANKKEIFGPDLSWGDHVRGFFGIAPRDSDGDGLPDSYETAHDLDRLNPDTDGDGVSDGEEVFKGLEPRNPDTDRDGVLDGRDIFPNDSTKSVSDSDIDTDRDGIGDRAEKILGTDPDKFDTDSDGVGDGTDQYPLDSHNQAKISTTEHLTNFSGLDFHIQNSVLGFAADLLTIMNLFILPVFLFMMLRWYWIFSDALEHYYNLYSKSIGYEWWMEKNYYNPKEKLPPKRISYDREGGEIVEREIDLFQPSEEPEDVVYNINPKWAIVTSYLSDTHEAMWRIGLLEADNMLGEVLRARGYMGKDIGEMLSNARFVTVNDAWEAHKVRNKIAHEGSSFNLSVREARRIYNLYENVFRDLNVI